MLENEAINELFSLFLKYFMSSKMQKCSHLAPKESTFFLLSYDIYLFFIIKCGILSTKIAKIDFVSKYFVSPGKFRKKFAIIFSRKDFEPFKLFTVKKNCQKFFNYLFFHLLYIL